MCMPRGAENEFGPQQNEISCSSSIFNTISEHASSQVERDFCFLFNTTDGIP